MVIAKAASRNVALKADMMSQVVLEAQASFVTPEATDQDIRMLRQSDIRVTRYDDDVKRNADFYTLIHFQSRSRSAVIFH
tara:strand:- start:286 stop:525 length:240 start_codon:yes stop_codon:yes gene_type:complete